MNEKTDMNEKQIFLALVRASTLNTRTIRNIVWGLATFSNLGRSRAPREIMRFSTFLFLDQIN